MYSQYIRLDPPGASASWFSVKQKYNFYFGVDLTCMGGLHRSKVSCGRANNMWSDLLATGTTDSVQCDVQLSRSDLILGPAVLHSLHTVHCVRRNRV